MLQPTGLAVLRELGLSDAARAKGTKITHLLGKTGAERTVLDVHYRALPGDLHGVGIHRASLFDLLHDAVRGESIAIETGQTIIGRDGGRLLFERGSAGPFDLIVDALGTRSPLVPAAGRDLAYGALWATLDWPGAPFDPLALEQRYEAARKMVGLLPIGGGKLAFFCSLRADRLEDWRAAGLDAWKSEVRALWPETAPLLDQIVLAEQLTFARYAHRTLRRPVEPGLVHIGDAWHSASPQLGQGANMALLDAWALALTLRAGDPRWLINLRGWHVDLYQALTALFTPVYQSDGDALPLVRDRIVGPLSKLWPATRIQAAMVAGLIGNPLPRLGLIPG